IKPDNVLLSHGTAVVTDFGIAKALSASRTLDGGAAATLTQAGGSIGTPAYMAPEQAVGDAVDHRADLYAWGVMAYELLSGAHPRMVCAPPPRRGPAGGRRHRAIARGAPPGEPERRQGRRLLRHRPRRGDHPRGRQDRRAGHRPGERRRAPGPGARRTRHREG